MLFHPFGIYLFYIGGLVTSIHAFTPLSNGYYYNPYILAGMSKSFSTKQRFASTSSFDTTTSTTNLLSNDMMIEDAPILASQVLTSEESTTTTSTNKPAPATTTKSYLEDGFIFGLEGSGLHRPKGKVASLVVDGDSLETTSLQTTIVTGTLLAHASFAMTSMLRMGIENWHLVQSLVNEGDSVMLTMLTTIVMTAIQIMGILGGSWIVADLGSGILHWAVDNYGNGRTPIMGSIIAAFQGHHAAPWTITQRGFANNVYKLCLPFGFVPISILTIMSTTTAFHLDPKIVLFVTSFCVLEILSQEFHKWSHRTKHENPIWVQKLQSVGFTVGPIPHVKHHQEPFDGNYCIISGFCNKPLDNMGFFRRLEYWIYQWNGVESNAWKLDPELKERTLRGDFSRR
jgi:palmitoyl-[glycerolipid] 3-(E)-desaturase